MCADCQPGGIGTRSVVPAYCEGSKTSGNSNSLFIVNLHLFGCGSDNLAHLRLWEKLAQCRCEIEVPGNENALGHAEAIFGNKCRVRFGVQPACIAAVGASTRLVKTLLLSLDDDIGRQKPDQVSGVFDQRTCALMQPELIRSKRRDTRIVNGADLAVRDQHNGHVAAATQPLATAQEVEPPLIGNNPAFTEASSLDRRKPAIGTYRR